MTIYTKKEEPVAYRWVESKLDCWRYDETPNPHRQCEPLYTHQDNSELRKAAEELISHGESGGGIFDGEKHFDKLRAALEAI